MNELKEQIDNNCKKLGSELGKIIDKYLQDTALQVSMDSTSGYSYDHRQFFIEFYDAIENYTTKKELESRIDELKRMPNHTDVNLQIRKRINQLSSQLKDIK